MNLVVSFGIRYPFSSVHMVLAMCTTACTLKCCNSATLTHSFSFGANFPLLFISSWGKIKNITEHFDKEAATFRQSLFPACLLHVLNRYYFFVASMCNLTKTIMVWNFWHVWRKYSCREAVAWKAGAVQNKNSRLQKADFINQRFRR